MENRFMVKVTDMLTGESVSSSFNDYNSAKVYYKKMVQYNTKELVGGELIDLETNSILDKCCSDYQSGGD